MHQRTVATGVALVLAAVLIAGCATMGPKKDQKAIENALAGWTAALEKQDIDAVMAFYSDNFTADEGAGKAELKEFLTKAKEQGYLEGVKADLTTAKKTLDKDMATAGPIVLTSNAGSMTVNLVMKREADKAWRIVSSSVES